MSKIYVGEFLASKDKTRMFEAKSIVLTTNIENLEENLLPCSVIYEKVAPHLGKELFSKKVFPLVTSINGKAYQNDSIIDATAVIVEDKEWGVIDDESTLEHYIKDFMDDPNYNQNVRLLEEYYEYNQSLTSGIIQNAVAFGKVVKARTKIEVMDLKAKQFIKSNRK